MRKGRAWTEVSNDRLPRLRQVPKVVVTALIVRFVAWRRRGRGTWEKKEKEMRTRSVFRYKLHDYEERERKRERDPKEKS